MSGQQSDAERVRRELRAPTRDLGSLLLVGDPAGSARVVRLPGPARLVWDALAEPASIDEVATMLGDQLNVDDARSNVAEVVEILEQIGAVVAS